MKYSLALKIALSALLMGSIPVWIRLVDGSSVVIAVGRLSLGLGLTLAVMFPKIEIRKALLGAPSVPSVPSAQDVAGTLKKPPPRWILPVIGILFGAHWFTYFESIQRSSATLGILALSTYGIHVMWMGAVFSDRRPTAHDWLAVLLAVIGAYICLPAPEVDQGAFIGFMFGLVSAVFYAALPLMHQRITHLSHSTRAAGQFFFAWLLFLPLIPMQDWSMDASSWWMLGVLGVLCTFVAHNLWISITTEVRPATTGMLYYLSLPITMLLESWLLHHPPTFSQATGAALILCGNLYAFFSRMRALRTF